MAKKPKAFPRDVAVLHGPTEDGKGARLLRFRDGKMSAGEVRPAREGQPLGDGELVRLKPLHDEVPVCEVEVLHSPADSKRQPSEDGGGRRSPGPARVSNERYRDNWGAVFGGKRRRETDGSDYSVN